MRHLLFPALGLNRLGYTKARSSSLSADDLVWIIRDDYLTPTVSPLTSPRVCEPGGGTLTLAQIVGQLSISPAEQLNWTVSSGQTNMGWYSDAITKTAGYTLIIKDYTISAYNQRFGWKETQNIAMNDAGGPRYGFSSQSNRLEMLNINLGAAEIGAALALSTVYQFAVVLRPTGTVHLIKGGIYASWHPIWASPSTLAATLYAGWNNTSSAGHQGRYGVVDMATSGFAAYAAADGLAKSYTASPSQGQSGAADADGMLVFRVASLPTAQGDSISLIFRRVNSNNYCRIVLTKDAGATCSVAVQEITNGVAATITNGTSTASIAANDWITLSPFESTVRVLEGAAAGLFTMIISTTLGFTSGSGYEWETISVGAAVADFYAYHAYLPHDLAVPLNAATA